MAHMIFKMAHMISEKCGQRDWKLLQFHQKKEVTGYADKEDRRPRDREYQKA